MATVCINEDIERWNRIPVQPYAWVDLDYDLGVLQN